MRYNAPMPRRTTRPPAPDLPPRQGRRAGALQQFLQVVLQVAVVGQAGLTFVVQTDLDVAVGDLQGLGETRQSAQASHGQVLGMRQLAQPQQRHTQLRRQQGGQRAILGDFDADGVHAGGFRVVAHAVKQHRFSYAAQTDHQHAARGLPRSRALHSDANGFSQVIVASEFRRRGSGWFLADEGIFLTP